VIPPDADLTARQAEIPAWDDMPDDLKPVLARQMEVDAGFLEHLLDLGYPGWQERQTWRRQGLANGRTGALDLPGRTGGTGPWSTAAMACSWPATWSPPRAYSARSPSPALSTPAAAPSTMP
jgi:hypothetical protein